MRATGEVLGRMIQVWHPSSFPTLLSRILQWGASSPSVEVSLGLCQTLHTAGVCPKLYQCLGYSLDFVDVGGSDRFHWIGSPWLHSFNQCMWGEGRSPGHTMARANAWSSGGDGVGKRGNLLPIWLVTWLNRVGVGPEHGKAVGRWRENGTKCM